MLYPALLRLFFAKGYPEGMITLSLTHMQFAA